MASRRRSRSFACRALVALVRFYQRRLSAAFAGMCLYQPSCSHYALEALEQHGALRGSALAGKRLARCRPPYQGGIDPVPPVDS